MTTQEPPTMTTTEQLAKFRSLAEAALADSEPTWTYVAGPLLGDVHVETRPSAPGRSRIRLDPNAIGPFVAAASPGAILALLDKVDRSAAASRKNADQAADLAVENAALKLALAMMTAARDEACEIANDFILGKFMSTARTRDQGTTRITELMKVGVP